MEFDLIINLVYVISAALFIFGLKLLGHPSTARKGNLLSANAMFIAIVVTLLDQSILGYEWIAGAMVAAQPALALCAASRASSMSGPLLRATSQKVLPVTGDTFSK